MSTIYPIPTGRARGPESAPRPSAEVYDLCSRRVYVLAALENTLSLHVITETTPHHVTVEQSQANATSSTESANALVPEQHFDSQDVEGLRRRVELLSRPTVSSGELYDQKAA